MSQFHSNHTGVYLSKTISLPELVIPGVKEREEGVKGLRGKK